MAILKATRRRGVGAALFALAAAACILPGGNARAQDLLLSNHIGELGNEELASASDAAQEFTTGAWPTGATLTSISLLLIVPDSATTLPTVRLMSGSANGTMVAELTAPPTFIAQPNAAGPFEFTAPPNTRLLPSTTYWVVAEGGPTGVAWEYVSADRERSSSLPGWSVADVGETRVAADTGSFTARGDGASFQMIIRGTADLPPPPDADKVLVHNLDRTATNLILALSSTGQVAQVFRTGSNSDGYDLDSVELVFAADVSAADIGDLDVSVWTLDSFGHPQTERFGLDNPSDITAGGITEEGTLVGPTAIFRNSSGTPLAAGTPYAVVVSYDQSKALFSTSSNLENTGAVFSIDDAALESANSGSSWAANSDDGGHSLSLRVNGSARAPNTAAAGAPSITVPNVYRVPAVLGVDLGNITDANGRTRIADSASYNWQRFAADGNTLEQDAIGTGATYTLTAADTGKKIKVQVRFTDDAGYAEGPLTSAAVPSGADTVTAAAVCNAPNYVGGAVQVWTGTVGVERDDDGDYYGFFHNTWPFVGTLDNTTFTLNSGNYEILGIFVRGSGEMSFQVQAAYTNAEKRTLVLHVCDAPFPLNAATAAQNGGNKAVFWSGNNAAPDWSTHAERTLYLSQDTAAPTALSASVDGTSLTITFNEDLGAAANLANSAFTVTQGTSDTAVALSSATAPAIAGDMVTLTLDAALSASDRNVKVDYTAPDSGSGNKIIDKFGNEAEGFTDLAVRLPNAAAAGAPAVTVPNVYRVPAVLGVNLGGITDANGKDNIADNATYNWQRFAADGLNLEQDAIGTGATYALTAADVGRKIKVQVSFTDDAGYAEGPLTSAAAPTGSGTVTAAAVCNEPTYVGGAVQVWTGKVGVENSNNTNYGFVSDASPTYGTLDDTTFTLGGNNDYEIDELFVNSGGGLSFSVDSDLTAAEQRTLVLHVCDTPFTLSSATGPTNVNSRYGWPNTSLDWSAHAERTLYLSQDSAPPTVVSASVNGALLKITFNEDLGAASNLANSAFTLTKGASDTAVALSGTTAPAIDGNTVTLTLNAALPGTDTDIKVDYTQPDSGSDNKLADKFGNEVANFTDRAVGNELADTTAPVLDATDNPPALAADGRTLTLTYNEALNATSVPAADAFTVNATYAGETTAEAQALIMADMDAGFAPVRVSGSTVVLTLAKALLPGDTVTVSYEMPTGADARIEDAAGNDAGSFTDQAVTNGAATVQVSVAALYDTAMPGVARPRYTVTRATSGTDPLEVTLDITQSEDYVIDGMTTDPLTTYTVTIPANETSVTEAFTFTERSPGTLTMTLAEGEGYAVTRVSGANTATVNIVDGSVDVALTQTSYSVTEGDNLTVNVKALGPAGFDVLPDNAFQVAFLTEEALTIDLESGQEKAAVTVDYEDLSSNLDFAPAAFSVNSDGRFEATIPVTVVIVDDMLREPAPERFHVYIRSAQGVSRVVVPDQTRIPVLINDNGDTAAGIESITFDSSPISSDTYGRDEVILIGVTFTEPVVVTGRPQFEFVMSGNSPSARQAGFYDVVAGNHRARHRVRFAYRVLAADSDSDGISWGANKITLNNGSIRSSESGAPVDVLLEHDAASSGHKVDGSINNNTAATGAVTISGTAEVGQTLEAVTSALADATDGLTSPVYRYQWIRVDSGTDTEIDGATMSAYLVQGADLGKKIKVRVRFRDDKGYFEEKTSGESDEVDPPREMIAPELVPDADGPAVLGADGVTLTLTYNEDLDENSEPSPSAFGLNVSGLTGVVQSVDVVGFTVVLTLAPDAVTSSRPVNNTDTVLLSYDKPNTNPIQDLAGNDAGDFTDLAVRNDTISPPSAPRSVAASAGNASAGLSWNAPANDGGAAIVEYQYRVSDDGGTTWNPNWTDVPDGPDLDSDPGNERAYTVTGLTNGAAYRFEVRAYNGMHHGPGGRSEATPQSGPPREPSEPLSLHANPLDTVVALSWSAPADSGNRVITRYEVRYAEGNSVPSGTAWTDVGLSFSHTLTGLKNDAEHTFEVRAVNEADLAGAPARARATPAANPAAPSPVQELRAAVRSRTVLLYWRPPLRAGGSDTITITGYEVCFAAGAILPPDAPCYEVEPDVSPGEVREGFRDLDNGVEYTFVVRAVNDVGTRGAPATVRAVPKADTAPGTDPDTDTQPGEEPVAPLSAPRSLRAAAGEPYVDRGSDAVTEQTSFVDVTLSWQSPAEHGNNFGLTYEYRYAEGGSVPDETAWSPAFIDGAALETVVRGLKTSTRYTFEVRARESSPAYGTEVEYGPAARASLTTPRYRGPTMTLSVGSSVNEGQALTVTVTRSPATGAATAFVEINDKGAPDDDRFDRVVDGETRYSTFRTVAVEFADGVSRASNTRYTPAYDGERDSNRELTVRIGAAQNDDVPGKTYSLDTRTRTVRVNDRDAGLRVDDDSVREGPGATLDFVVRLTRSRPWDVMVDYATSDGSSGSTLTATAPSDYTSVADTLTIPAGSTRATISVPVLDDVVNDDGETLTLTLSNVRGGDRYIGDGVILEDATAVGTIRNTDPLPAAWLARFGRAAAVQVTDLLSDRFETAGNTPDRLTLGGRPVDVAALRNTLDDPSGLYRADDSKQGVTTPHRHDGGVDNVPNYRHDGGVDNVPNYRHSGESRNPVDQPVAAGDTPDPVPTREATLLERTLWTLLNSRGRVQFDTRQFLAQSSFDLSLTATDTGPDESVETLPAAPDSTGRWSLWGRGAMTHFSGQDTGVNLSGDVLTGLIGLDYARDRWLAGTALAYHDGNGSYTSTRNPGAGDLDSTLITVNPYLRYAVNERLSAWGTAGYGTGTLALRQQRDSVPQEAIETDLRLAMGAVGLRGVLYAGEATQLALKTDALWVRTSSEATDGMQGAGADTSRLRLLLTGQHQRALANDALLSPNVELGIRYDDGDAETGFGMELGGGVRYADALLGLSVETKARALIAHEDGQYQEWGLSGSVSLDPGRLGRGLALNLSSGWGAAESNAQAMWQRQTTAGIAPQQDLAAQARFTAEAGYGLDVPWTHAILTPYTGLEWAGQGRTLRLGWRYTLGQRLNVSLDGERRENGHTRPEHALMLRTSLPW